MPLHLQNAVSMGISLKYKLLKKLYHNRRFAKPASTGADLQGNEREIVAALRTKGIYAVDGFLAPAECDRLRAIMDSLIDSAPAGDYATVAARVRQNPEFKYGVPSADGKVRIWTDEHTSDVRIIGSEALDETFRRLSADPSFSRIGNAIVNVPLRFKFQMANRVSFVPDNLGSGGGWHRDQNYANGFKVLLYLNDVGIGNGPFEFLEGSQSVGCHLRLTDRIDQYQFADSVVEEAISKYGFKRTVMTCKKGSAVFFNTNGIHRGMPIMSGRRYAITNYYN